MIWLWVAAALVSAALAALIVYRAAAAAAAKPGADAPALAVYRRQMAEVDELADRGLIDESERRSVRAETGRRLLAAATRAQPTLRAASPGAVLALAAAAPMAALAIYVLAVGDPRYPDQPFARRLATWRGADPATLSAPEMAAVLRQISAVRPADPEPLAMLARAELAAGAPTEAVQALRRAIAIAPGRADLSDLMGEILSLGPGPHPDADAAFRQAQALDPSSPAPRYFLARDRIAAGDTAGGLADWRALLASLPASDPRRAELADDIAAVERFGSLPPEGGGPASSGQGAAPQIQAMVDSLAARLKAQPDDPAGWVRLVRAYAVLGEQDRLRAALEAARTRFGARAEVIAALETAAKPPRADAVSSPRATP